MISWLLALLAPSQVPYELIAFVDNRCLYFAVFFFCTLPKHTHTKVFEKQVY